MHSEGPGQAQEMCPPELHDVQQDQVQSPAPGSGHPLVSSEAGAEEGHEDDQERCYSLLGTR